MSWTLSCIALAYGFVPKIIEGFVVIVFFLSHNLVQVSYALGKSRCVSFE